MGAEMKLTNVPKQQFILDRDLILGLNREEVSATWKDMLELGIADPPAPHFTIRMSGKAYVDLLNVSLDRIYDDFQHLHDRVEKIRVEYRETGRFTKEEETLAQLSLQIAQRLELRDKVAEIRGMADVLIDYRFDKSSNVVEVQRRLYSNRAKQVPVGQKGQFDSKEIWTNAEYFLYVSLIVLLTTRGVVKETKVSKLAKLGIGKADKPAVTTSLRLGAPVYVKDEISPREGEPGYSVRAHLRRGHIRNQHYGPKMQLVKKVFIEPVFVNADRDWIAHVDRKHYNVSKSNSAVVKDGA